MRNASAVVEGAKLGGWFDFDENRKLLGELTIEGATTKLYLHDDAFFHIDWAEHIDMTGVLHDRTKVTLAGCTIVSGPGSATQNGQHFHYFELSPSYVLTGPCHIAVRTPSITGITLRVDDAELLFHDFDAFGLVIDPGPLIESVVRSNKKWADREVPIGPDPEICYFTGRRDVATVSTEIGTISVKHRTFANPLTIPRRIGIENRTLIQIDFGEPQTLEGALDRIMTMLRFLEIVGGRPQNPEWLSVVVPNGEQDVELALYWCLKPRRSTHWEERAPHPAEILLDVVRQPDEFAQTLRRWIELDKLRMPARVRFSGGFGRQRSFTIDRLVGAANMFDILPDDALPEKMPLAEETSAARDEARKLFKALQPSDERESILGALGRLGQRTLRQKIMHRARIIDSALGNTLSDLNIVVDEAVKCRNHFVHGSPGSFDYSKHSSVVSFLTQALEFLFAGSDFVDAGWNPAAWHSRGSILAHPFNRLLHSWDQDVAELRKLRA